MVAAGASGRFYYVSSSNPGSKHDSRIAMESLLIRKLNDRSYVPFFDINGDIAKLIADSAYKGDKDYLLVPIPIPDAERSRKKKRYNKIFKKARASTIECNIGVTKARFPVLCSCIMFKDVTDSGIIQLLVLTI